MDRLKDKVAVITGGNSGVGATAAKLFAREGAKVVISARRQPQLEAVAEEIRADGGDVLCVVTDISKPEDAANLLEKAEEAFGPVDILINNAGVLEEGLKPIDKVEDADMDRIIDTNLKGTMYVTREAAKRMAKNGKGSIVNVASVAGEKGCGGAAYVSSKAGVIGVTKHTAMRFCGQGIRANVVCPGNIVTPMTMNQNPADLDQDMFSQMCKHADMKAGICMPEDVANIVLFLASDEARAVTGQVLVADFGSNL